MTYNFKKFTNRNARLETRISVTKSFSFGLPTKFYRDNNLKEFKFVVLFYDEAEKAVGIHFTNDEKEESKYAIVHSKSGYGGGVVARSFFSSFNIDPQKYHGKYEWQKHLLEGVGELFVVELRERWRTDESTTK